MTARAKKSKSTANVRDTMDLVSSECDAQNGRAHFRPGGRMLEHLHKQAGRRRRTARQVFNYLSTTGHANCQQSVQRARFGFPVTRSYLLLESLISGSLFFRSIGTPLVSPRYRVGDLIAIQSVNKISRRHLMRKKFHSLGRASNSIVKPIGEPAVRAPHNKFGSNLQ